MSDEGAHESTIEELYSTVAGELAEGRIQALLDESLGPRGPEMLFDLAAECGVGPSDLVLDAGCRDGRHVVELVRRFGCRVVGVDLIAANLAWGQETLRRAGDHVRGRSVLVQGDVQRLPFGDGAFSFVWNRDVMIHLPDLEAGLRECRRVLRPGGRMLVFQMFATSWLSEDDAARLWPPLAAVPRNADPSFFEACLEGAGWRVERVEHVGSEWREHAEETGPGRTSTQLLHVARLLRDPDRYVAGMGPGAYESELGNALWGVYQMIGKLSARVYVLA
jgi:SAM-dependent methyltransferase